MQTFPQNTGWIEVICGPMFSGKTEELLRRVRQVMAAKQTVQLFKPRLDQRYALSAIVSHLQRQLPAEPVACAREILSKIQPATRVIAIDEGQFLGKHLISVCNELADRNVRVIVAGLDQDFQGLPFQPMPELMALAEFVTKILAICSMCGNPAGRSQRLVHNQERIIIGASSDYEPRCRACHQVEIPQEMTSSHHGAHSPFPHKPMPEAIN